MASGGATSQFLNELSQINYLERDSMDNPTPIMKNLSTSNIISKTTFPQIQQQFLDKSFLNITTEQRTSLIGGLYPQSHHNNLQSILNASDWRSFSKELLRDDQQNLSKIKSQRTLQGKKLVKKQIRQWKDELKNSSPQKLKDLEHFFKHDIKPSNQPQLNLDLSKLNMTTGDNQNGFFTERRKSIQEAIDTTQLEPLQTSRVIGNRQKSNNNSMRFSVDLLAAVQSKSKDQSSTLQEFQSMKLLQNVKYYNFFRDFAFPQSTLEIKEFIEQYQNQRPFKQIFFILQKRLESYNHPDNPISNINANQQNQQNSEEDGDQSPIRQNLEVKEKQSKSEHKTKAKRANKGEQNLQFKKNAIMNQRDQFVILEEWFNFMITKYSNENFEQLLIVAFAMGDLIQMEFLSCTQKGQVLLKILQFFLTNQLRWLDNDNSKDKLIESLQQQLRHKKKFIKSQDEKFKELKRKMQQQQDSFDELELQYKQLQDQNELLQSKYAYEHRLMEKKFSKEREEMQKAHQEQKQIIEETLDTMIKLKTENNKHNHHPSRPTDDSHEYSSEDEDEMMMNREEMYQNKLGRQDSMTRDLMQKNADYKKNRNQKGLYEIEMEKLNSQGKLGSTITSMKTQMEKGDMSSKNRDSKGGFQEEIKPKRKLRLKTRFGKNADENVLSVRDEEVQTNEKHFADVDIQVNTRELSKDVASQITPPIIYTYSHEVQTEDQNQFKPKPQEAFTQCGLEFIEPIVEERANELVQERLLIEIKKFHDQQRILDDINDEYADSVREQMIQDQDDENTGQGEAIEDFDVRTQNIPRMSLAAANNTEGQRTGQNFHTNSFTTKNLTQGGLAGKTQSDFSGALMGQNQQSNKLQSKNTVDSKFSHKRTSSVALEQIANQKQAIFQKQMTSTINTPAQKKLTKLQAMKQDLSNALARSFNSSQKGIPKQQPISTLNKDQQILLNSLENQKTSLGININQDQMIELVKKYSENNKEIKMDDLIQFVKQNAVNVENQDQQSSQLLRVENKNNANFKTALTFKTPSKFKPNIIISQPQLQRDSINNLNEEQYFYQPLKLIDESTSENVQQQIPSSSKPQDIELIIRQLQSQLKSSKSPFLNSLLDQPEIQKLFGLVLNESQKELLTQSTAEDTKTSIGVDNFSENYRDFEKQGHSSTHRESKRLLLNQKKTSNIIRSNDMTEDSILETQYEEDLKDLIMNDSQIASVELPKILFKATDKFQKSLEFLPKDEYGDYILHQEEGDENTQKVLKRGEKLKEWIEYLQKESEGDKKLSGMLQHLVTITSDTLNNGISGVANTTTQKITVERGIQTQITNGFDSLNQIKMQLIKDQNDRSLTNIKTKQIEAQSRLLKQTESSLHQSLLKKINSKQKNQKTEVNHRSSNNLSLLVARDALEVKRHLDRSSSVKKKPSTIFFPLALNFDTGTQKPTTHPMTQFYDKFLVSLHRKDLNFFNGIQTMSIKLLIRTMNIYLTEKGTMSMDHHTIKNQNLQEFIYDQCFNKFGIQRLAEKKIKEIVYTVWKSHQKIGKCLFYAKLLGFNSQSNKKDGGVVINYFNDDLSLIYKLNRLLNDQNAFDSYNKHRQIPYYFDNESMKCDALVQFYLDYFSFYLNAEEIQKFIEDMRDFLIDQNQLIILPENKSRMDFRDFKIKSERGYDIVVVKYQDLKQRILTQMNELKNFEDVGIKEDFSTLQKIQNKHLNFITFQEMVNKISRRLKIQNDELVRYFEKNKFINHYHQDGNQNIKHEIQLNEAANSVARQQLYVISLEKVVAFIFKHNLL